MEMKKVNDGSPSKLDKYVRDLYLALVLYRVMFWFTLSSTQLLYLEF